LKDGRRFKAEVRGTDPQSDIAVIKIEAKGLPVATFADSSQTRVGEFAIAIGAPFQLDYSVTFGHVSAKGRGNVVPSYAGGAMMDQDFIQTDANINPGNSGGPLVNINGEVIGMNTLIRGLQTGIGFAIPSNLAKEVSAQLIAEGKFTRAWLGIGIRALKEDQAFRELVTSVSEGVVVASILPEGPAYKSDLKPADVITAVDGKPVATVQALKDEIRGKKIGAPVTLDVVRNDKNIKVKVSPGEWIDKTMAAKTASEEAKKDNVSALGLTVQAFTRELAEQFSVELTEGVIVTAVDKNSAAARSMIKPGDVVTDVNQRKVSGPRAFRELLKGADLKKGVLLNLISGNTSRFEILKGADE
jgi:serine protease Do